MKPTENLRRLLEEARVTGPGGEARLSQSGPLMPSMHIGDVVIQSGYRLRHEADRTKIRAVAGLRKIANSVEFRELLRFDANGDFRPLKSGKNLRHGWEYGPLTFDELVIALQHLYPVAVAHWTQFVEGRLETSEWPDVAARQTGRFKVVSELPDEALEEIVRKNCDVLCAKKRLWHPRSQDAPEPVSNPQEIATTEIPLICREACSLLVGKAREFLKGPMDD